MAGSRNDTRCNRSECVQMVIRGRKQLPSLQLEHSLEGTVGGGLCQTVCLLL